MSKLLESIQKLRILVWQWCVDDKTRYMLNVQSNLLQTLTEPIDSFNDVIIINWLISVIPISCHIIVRVSCNKSLWFRFINTGFPSETLFDWRGTEIRAKLIFFLEDSSTYFLHTIRLVIKLRTLKWSNMEHSISFDRESISLSLLKSWWCGLLTYISIAQKCQTWH